MTSSKKSIVITGSTRGIGFGLAQNFLKLGHLVVINGRSEESLKKALSKLSVHGQNVLGFVGDINDNDFPLNLYQFAISHFKEVNIWINNAGISQTMTKVWTLTLDEIQNHINTNLTAPIKAMRLIIPLLEKQGGGLILNMEGLGSDGRMVDKLALYGTSKRGINYISKAASKELKNSNVDVGIIGPGMVLTDFILGPMEHASEKDRKNTRFIMNLLGEKVETVAPYLVRRILKTNSSYPRIQYLTKLRIIKKVFRHAFVKRDLFKD